MSDVTTRADDRWARLTLLLWSQREEDWRERVKSGKMISTIEPSTCTHTLFSTTKGSESICQIGKLHEMSATTLGRRSATTGRRRRFYARKPWRRRKWPEGWRNRRTELSDPLQDGLGATKPRFPTLEQMNDQLRNDQPNNNESEPGTDITNSHGSREQTVPTTTSRKYSRDKHNKPSSCNTCGCSNHRCSKLFNRRCVL